MTQTIRRNFLNYFKSQGHTLVPSSAVFPYDDPTILFTNAGMNQFKDVFLGRSHRDYTRAATSQKCIRVGGKHNDLENVGHTKRHLTFFEMIGNFSFGEYFKEEAIRFAWEVSTKVFELDPNKIWPTVYKDDDEAFELWTKYVPRERITRFGEKENFWAMGDTGPCGPCSELLYDRGEKYGDAKNPSEDTSGERFLEYWNLVFMQFNRDEKGVLNPLPKPSVDTGSGLERVVSLKMDVDSVFETDVLRGIIAKTEEVLGVKYDPTQESASAFRVIADHLRCLSFAIADGVQPSNVDRGYVLRKVLRRAVRYGRQLGADKPFLAHILPELIRLMGPDYPELVTGQSRIAEIITLEEESFLRTLNRGGNLLNQILENAKKKGEIPGDEAFKLKDTYGFPLEEIQLIAKDHGLEVNLARYKELEDEAKEKSRQVHKGTKQMAEENQFEQFVKEKGPTQFVGYDHLTSDSKILALYKEGQPVERLEQGDEGMVILAITPFYAEMGGQVGDKGTIISDNGSFSVTDTRSPYKGLIAHVGVVKEGTLSVNHGVKAAVDLVERDLVERNHTATHLLHWALHQVLGEHVKQAGSVVDKERLRFDFSHHKSLSPQEIQQIEDLVNQQVRTNRDVKKYELSYDEASKRADIKQFFGEKYGSLVRVIDIEDSKELCGGTHTSNVGKIGLFRISKEGSIAAGVRRIEAVTGEEAELLFRKSDQLIDDMANLLKVTREKLPARLNHLVEENRLLALELKAYKKKELEKISQELISQKEEVSGKSVLFAEVSLSAEDFKLLGDEVMSRLGQGAMVLGNKLPDRSQLLVRISDDLVQGEWNAGQLIKKIAPLIEGTGGGKPNSAQAGGKQMSTLAEPLKAAKELLKL